MITLSTTLACQVPLEGCEVACGADVPVGGTLGYAYKASEGCQYKVYNAAGKCIVDCKLNSVPDSSVRGGAFTIESDMARITFSDNARLYKVIEVTVADIIRGASSIAGLHAAFDTYNIDAAYQQDIINLYLDGNRQRYRRGQIYMSVIDNDPALLFGGEWERIVGVFPDGVFAWANIGARAVCGEFTCGQAMSGQ